MARFSKINVGADKTFDVDKLSPEMKVAFEAGMADAWQSLDEVKREMGLGKVTSGDTFGTRAHLKNNYLYRMTAPYWAFTAIQKKRRCIRCIWRILTGKIWLERTTIRYVLQWANAASQRILVTHSV